MQLILGDYSKASDSELEDLPVEHAGGDLGEYPGSVVRPGLPKRLTAKTSCPWGLPNAMLALADRPVARRRLSAKTIVSAKWSTLCIMSSGKPSRFKNLSQEQRDVRAAKRTGQRKSESGNRNPRNACKRNLEETAKRPSRSKASQKLVCSAEFEVGKECLEVAVSMASSVVVIIEEQLAIVNAENEQLSGFLLNSRHRNATLLVQNM